MKRLTALLFSLLLAAAVPVLAQSIKWTAAVEPVGDGVYELILTGKLSNGYYTHPLTDPYTAAEIELEGTEPEGDPEDVYTPADYKGETVVKDTYILKQKFRSADGSVKGTVTWQSCTGDLCGMPEDWEFEAGGASAAGTVSPTVKPAKGGSAAADTDGTLWALIIEAILWGLASLLTPCVFPMVPMTVSFFLKGSENKARGRFRAAMYGLFIVLLYTVPISIIIGLTRILGGATVTSDIFNWLATHWLPNLLFFAIFMIFAASFFGAFEITLPSKWTNSADKNSDKAGLGGVFFLALTLVLVSFSCTGPIVGSVLIKSTQGEFWTPMITMLAFSLAFALPFTIFALFPSLLKGLPKSGGWLNSVKVVLGFIEIALGLKFLSTADQTYHWGLLDREVYLAIWIVVFSMLGFYLLGKLRFKHDSPVEHISLLRLTLAIAVFTFVVYMVPGMWGAPLKAISGYLPPIETQDFVIGNYSAPVSQTEIPAAADGPTLRIAHGLTAYDNIDDALKASKETGKPVFVDITGLGCVNCREMEARVWSDPKVLPLLRDRFIIVALYNDDKAKLPEDKWVTTENGKVLKGVGRVNAYIAQERFGVSSQPNYALLDSDGKLIAPVRGYNLSIDGFVDFLNQAL
ncbi:MAG: thioredoxin family protein [Bacteroidales bacterium]|nr:thioredoxin family protein [Bacteroidales bacterium]